MGTTKKSGKAVIECYGVDLNEMDNKTFEAWAEGFYDNEMNQAPTTKRAFKKWIEKQDIDESIFREDFYEFMEEYNEDLFGEEPAE